eukprot:5469844-Prymnesium_polylepis.1
MGAPPSIPRLDLCLQGTRYVPSLSAALGSNLPAWATHRRFQATFTGYVPWRRSLATFLLQLELASENLPPRASKAAKAAMAR